MRQATDNKSTDRPLGKFISSFVEHPASVDETYLQHFCFAFKFATRLFGAAMAALIHALIPALFETTASRLVQCMHADIEKRHASAEQSS